MAGSAGTCEFASDPSPENAEDLYLRGKLSGHYEAYQGVGRWFVYLGADRFGPLNYQESGWQSSHELEIDSRGKGTLDVLEKYETASVPSRRRHPSGQGGGHLRGEVEQWLSEWFGHVRLRVEWFPNAVVSSVSILQGGVKSEEVRPTNTGFGISYALPIVVAGLWLNEGGTLIVDSPEAHLHPRVQSAIGRFVAHMAKSGVQVILETHSDHIVNGVRLAVAKGLEGLASSDVCMYFFDRGATVVSVEKVQVKPSGAVAKWPKGFFDQIENDLRSIMEQGRGR